ncbi:hypothetical protein ACH5RR_015211 [Cinchona calisaya]|uniref:F-box domain-containing protein n=1 Tax=Cinchona calisaya TaxID=153742 RepID=A0ABD2ZW21_9GENT
MEDSLNQIFPAQKQEEDENPFFKRLPDEIIVSHIFGRIFEAKSLFFCSLVSKHFSSLVYQTKKVSFKIPLKRSPSFFSLSLPRKLLHFITTPFRLVIWLFQSIAQRRTTLRFRPSDISMDDEFVYHLITKFLVKFRSIKSLHIELDHSRLNFNKEPMVKWNMDSKSASFILLSAKSSLDDDVVNENDTNISAVNEMMELLGFHLECHMPLSYYRLSIMKMLAPLLPASLQKVVVTDSKNQGKLTVGESDLVEMRNGNGNSEENREVKLKMRFWHAPLLKLPLSGSVMRKVNLFVCNDDEDQMDDSLIVKEAFEREEEEEDDVFGEAVMKMVKKEVVYETVVQAIISFHSLNF